MLWRTRDISIISWLLFRPSLRQCTLQSPVHIILLLTGKLPSTTWKQTFIYIICQKKKIFSPHNTFDDFNSSEAINSEINNNGEGRWQSPGCKHLSPGSVTPYFSQMTAVRLYYKHLSSAYTLLWSGDVDIPNPNIKFPERRREL